MNPQEIIGGFEIERDSMGGYPTWSMAEGRWHLNFKLGGTKKGKEVYHVTREDCKPKEHYFFTLDRGKISDSLPETQQKGAKKFSALPEEVKDFVRTHIDDLLPK